MRHLLEIIRKQTLLIAGSPLELLLLPTLVIDVV